MPSSGSYLVRSLDHPDRVVVIHLEVVERETILAYEHRIRELHAQVARLRAECDRLRAARKRVA
jgi:hypothetical protein